MHSLKDSNPKVYKIFSEGNLVIPYAYTMTENGQDWHPIQLVIKQPVMRSLKSNGVQ